jgi:hypothetical protein
MTSRTDNMSAGNNRATYIGQYRTWNRLEEDNCNNVHKRTNYMPSDSVNIEQHINTLSVEYMRNYRKRKAQENKTPEPSTLTDATPTPNYIQL